MFTWQKLIQSTANRPTPPTMLAQCKCNINHPSLIVLLTILKPGNLGHSCECTIPWKVQMWWVVLLVMCTRVHIWSCQTCSINPTTSSPSYTHTQPPNKWFQPQDSSTTLSVLLGIHNQAQHVYREFNQQCMKQWPQFNWRIYGVIREEEVSLRLKKQRQNKSIWHCQHLLEVL